MRTSRFWMRLTLAITALTWGISQGAGQTGKGQGSTSTGCVVGSKTFNNCPPGLAKQAKREAARKNAAPQKKGVSKKFAGVSSATATISPLATGPTTLATMTPGATPDYFGVGNYANSPLPVIGATGAITPGTGLRKFVDTLPGLCALGANDLGQCIPLATPDTTTFPGNDFYRVGLSEYLLQMHADLPSTKLRGYVQLDPLTNLPVAGKRQYLGPLILATKNRPVRVLFKNMISTDLNVPTDITYNGAGSVTDGVNSAMASQQRATLHLHGGNTPWISDGTTHQWITPATEITQPLALGFKKGFSFKDVPDMVPPGCVGAQCVNLAPSLTDGLQTFYWTNKQSGRLMFFHDHAFGITRLNVYAGEAAGYLLVDPAQETALAAATVPGTITAANPPVGDLTHVIPLVIQDKTFVSDDGTATTGSQLAAQDPTWDPIKWGGKGSLWFPHVYTPNQNPADLSGANGFGRWDWGPWFFPPQNPASLAAQSFACSSIATPPPGWAFPPLMCPGVPFVGASLNTAAAAAHVPDSPSGVPEGFMDTMVINGTAYPSLTVDPTAYRFHILSVGNDRTLNLGLYVADPLAISITAGGSGYAVPPAPPPAVTITGCTSITSATATVDANGVVTGITVVYPASGPGCTAPVTVAIAAPTAGTQAYAIASLNTEVKMVAAVSAAARPPTLPNCPTSLEPPMAGGGLVTALLDPSGNPLNGTGLPTGPLAGSPSCWPLYNSVMGFTAGPLGENGQLSWGNSDGRIGGVPDPTTAGPPIIQIGTEGGMLPAPAVIPSTPISYDYNKRSITVLNVLNHGLYLGPAERADVIVDFSKFAGKTLILYNDAPAPVPGADPRLDYFTNDPDFSSTGGAPSTMAGYGPNTRTIMQIKVNATCSGSCPAFSLPSLTAALPSIFASTQDQILVPEPAYPVGYGKGLAEYSRIQDTSLALNSPGPLCATPPCSQPMLPKAIQELFTLDYGRMNATLGVEMPLTSFTIQTTIPYGYADPPTEIFKNGEIQLWKITHNGVDTHFIHFHLFNVQVINRVGWDGAVKPPDPNELSFKDTVRMNPLEDIIVALQPLSQDPFPFAVPNSSRPLDVIHAIGYTSTTDFTNVDPTNQPAAVVNDQVNFGWEYVWHCHILGHEENDMMRAMILAVAPNPPTNLAIAPGPGLNQVTLTWSEAASPPYTGFTIQRATDTLFTQNLTQFTVGATPLSFVDTQPPGGPYYYRIDANNLVGYTRTYAAPAAGYPHTSADSAWSVFGGLGTPTVTFTGAPASAAYNTSFTVTATTNAGVAPTISGTAGVCTVGAVGGISPATATVTMISGTGICTLTASWPSGGGFLAATATQTTIATLATPTVTFTGAPASAAYSTSFTVTATTNAGIAPTISGTAGVCTVGAVSGTSPATAPVTMTSGTGTCTLTASWPATTNYAASKSTQSTAATKLATTTAITSNTPNPSVVGQPVTVNVSVTGTGPAKPTGTVTVNGNGASCIATLSAGAGSCSLALTSAGTKTLTATYNGDANYSTSTSAGASQTVRDFSITVSPTSWAVNGNQKASFKLTIAPINGFVGTVALTCSGYSAAPCSITPTSVTLNGTTSQTATVTQNTTKTGTGTFTLTFTGTYSYTGGSRVRTATATLTVK